MQSSNSARLILLTALLLGWLADFFFYSQTLGISVPLFALLLLIALVGLGWREGISPLRAGLGLGVPLLFLATMVFVRANLFVTTLNLLGSLALLGLLAHFYAAGRLTGLGLLGYPAVLIETGLNALIRPAPLVAASADMAIVREQGRRNVLPLVRGLALAVPVLAIFTCFLASADLVFAGYVKDALNLEFLPNIFEWLWRGFLIVTIGWLLAGGLAYTFKRSHGDGQGLAEKVTGQLASFKFLGLVEVTTVLVLVDLLFLIFVVIQFAYLFGGQANIAVEGYSYAEYARRGFFELLAVSVLALGLILGLHRLGRRQPGPATHWFNGLSSLMVGLVLVILASAFQRLMLYEAAFGYTELRLYSHIFMVWLAGTLLWFLLTLWGKPHFFALGAFGAALGFVLTINLINPDAFIARQNLARYQAGGHFEATPFGSGSLESSFARASDALDITYLAGLSDDVVPGLVAAWPHLDAVQRDSLQPHLITRRDRLAEQLPQQSWVSFHLARWRALTALEQLPLD